MSDIPRRNQMQQWCPAERSIQEAVDVVERMGADIRLTDAVVLLAAARDRVADFVDGVEGRRTVDRDRAVNAVKDGRAVVKKLAQHVGVDGLAPPDVDCSACAEIATQWLASTASYEEGP